MIFTHCAKDTMGFYWHSFAYLGRLMTKESYERLKTSNIEIPEGWLKDINDVNGLSVLHIPSCYHAFRSIDPVLEDEEVTRGYVNVDDFYQVIGDEKAHPFRNPSEQDIQRLQRLIAAASEDGGDQKYGIYVVELQWSTYDNTTRVTRNIRVT